jgi:hypothetical protein
MGWCIFIGRDKLNQIESEGESKRFGLSVNLAAARSSSLGLGLFLALSGEEEDMDVGEHTTGGDGGRVEKLVELLVIADSELDVAGHNSGLLVVLGGVACELEDLSCEVLKDGGEVHGGTGSDALGEAASTELAGDSSDGELKSGAG